MPVRDTRILFVGDMHLGRLPSRVPESEPGGSLPPLAELGPGAAWMRTVDEAVRLEVDLVALAGDVVHQANDLFEGAGELDEGLQRLERAGIATVAVAGNHDTRVLPDLAGRRGFHLLGPGGTWSEHLIARDDAPHVRIVGWSFPSSPWSASPLATPPPRPASGTVTLGLLHADLDAAGSAYAPVSRGALSEVGYRGWFLGHVHKPGTVTEDGAPFYLGSLVGLDPSETGLHGPVLATVGGDGSLVSRRLALAPLRWHHLELDLSRLDDPAGDLPVAVHGALEELAGTMADGLAETRALGVRVRVTGEVADPSAVARAAAALVERSPRLAVGGTAVFIEKLICTVATRRDLRALALVDDAPGLLARRILVLEGATDVPGIEDAATERGHRLRAARRRLAAVDREDAFRRLDPQTGDEHVRELAAATARDLLDRLLSDKEGRRAAGQD